MKNKKNERGQEKISDRGVRSTRTGRNGTIRKPLAVRVATAATAGSTPHRLLSFSPHPSRLAPSSAPADTPVLRRAAPSRGQSSTTIVAFFPRYRHPLPCVSLPSHRDATRHAAPTCSSTVFPRLLSFGLRRLTRGGGAVLLNRSRLKTSPLYLLPDENHVSRMSTRGIAEVRVQMKHVRKRRKQSGHVKRSEYCSFRPLPSFPLSLDQSVAA